MQQKKESKGQPETSLRPDLTFSRCCALLVCLAGAVSIRICFHKLWQNEWRYNKAEYMQKYQMATKWNISINSRQEMRQNAVFVWAAWAKQLLLPWEQLVHSQLKCAALSTMAGLKARRYRQFLKHGDKFNLTFYFEKPLTLRHTWKDFQILTA